jgi:alkylation response protein AidB-like acyl-CoA dehydrogenase
VTSTAPGEVHALIVPDLSDEALAAVTAEVAETAAEYDQSGEVPVRGLEVAHRAGLFTATVGQRYSGPGASPLESARILTALGEGDPSVAQVGSERL